MKRSFFHSYLQFLFCLPFLCTTNIVACQDTVDRQLLYNGRVWRNLYSTVEGHAFLFSQEFLPGTITIGGTTFKNIKIRYDIFKDELLMLTDKIIILQANKEMIDGFSISYAGENFTFIKLEVAEGSSVSGFVNVVYDKATPLMIKYRKEIDTGGSDNINGVFYQIRKIYVKINGMMYQINSRNEFLRLLSDRKVQVKSYMKQNKIKVSKTNPSTYAAVLAFYDSLK